MFVVSSINDIIVKNLVIVLETQVWVVWFAWVSSYTLKQSLYQHPQANLSEVHLDVAPSVLPPLCKAPNKMCLWYVDSSGVSKAVESWMHFVI